MLRMVRLAASCAYLLVASNADARDVVTTQLSDGGTLTVSVSGEKVLARLDTPRGMPSARRTLSVGPRLQRILRHAEEVVSIAGKSFAAQRSAFFVLGVATPSVRRGGTGYCEAGTEDALLLVELNPRSRSIEIQDQILVQSCLRNMILQSDRGDLRSALVDVDDAAHITLVWLQHPQYGPAARTLKVERGKFVVLP